MSKSRLFDSKEVDQITSYYHKIYTELFERLKKPKYTEMFAVLQALMRRDMLEFTKTIDTLQQANGNLDYHILDYRDPHKKGLYKIPFKHWDNSFFGEGKSIRKALELTKADVLEVNKIERYYKTLCEARDALNASESKDTASDTYWRHLQNIKLKLDSLPMPTAKETLATIYQNAINVMQSNLFFKETIDGLSSKSISVNFSQMLSILVHGDEDLIYKTLRHGLHSESYTSIKEKHKDILREKYSNNFEEVVEFMEHKQDVTKTHHHDYYEIIPLFIKQCIQYQERLLLKEFLAHEREFTELERSVILNNFLHHDHSIKKNIIDNRNIAGYHVILFDDQNHHIIKNEHHYVLPSFAEYCEQVRRPSQAIAAKMH